MKRQGFLVLALCCGLLAAISTFYYLHNVNRSREYSLKPMVVVKTSIPARTVIQASQLFLKEVPAQGYPQGAFSTFQSVAGSISLVNLKPGDILLSPMLQRPASQAGLANNLGGTFNPVSMTVPEGKRAVAVPINSVSGVGYAVKPGDYVDVLVTLDIKDSSGSKAVTALAAQDVLVLSVGESMSNGDKSKVEAKTFTLALTVPQAMAVTYGSEKGSIRLLLRNPASQEIIKEPPVSSDIFTSPNYFNVIK